VPPRGPFFELVAGHKRCALFAGFPIETLRVGDLLVVDTRGVKVFLRKSTEFGYELFHSYLVVERLVQNSKRRHNLRLGEHAIEHAHRLAELVPRNLATPIHIGSDEGGPNLIRQPALRAELLRDFTTPSLD
jgi:hypothetical protein